MSKFTCGVCGKGVRLGAFLCTGSCSLWYHIKCVNMSDDNLKKMCKEKTNNWKCKNCKNNTCSSFDKSDCLANLEDKIQTINQDNDFDVNKSLTIAEAGALLLEENEKLKQRIYDLKTMKSHTN